MTAELRIPVPAQALTWDDLQAIPDDLHHHYQLIEGQILMAPSPNLLHQTIALALAVRLRGAASSDLQVVVAPFDFAPEPHTVLQPDLLVLRRGSAEYNRTVVPPVLAVEILSPSSRTTDRVTKRELYARHGVRHYWIVDPGGKGADVTEPSVLALELSEGAYTELGRVAGGAEFRASKPFPVEFTPAALLAG